ncbi:MAG: N-acetylmuramoyl-L-alanine amidase [Selenomonadales bacterium]|nr:N-acetylmuramoyl-L-alanine amidase [Selenomonadales bacterium]
MPHNDQPTPEAAADWVRSIWRWHATSTSGGHNWGDIGYNFIVDRFGNIYHGRHNPLLDGTPPQDVVGAHAGGFNTGSMGIAFLGMFGTTLPTSVALSSAEHLLAWRFRLRSLDPLGQALLSGRMLSRITGHDHTGGGTGAGCPGMPITNYLPTMRTNVSLRMRQVVAPNGGEVWPLNTQQTIRWDFAAISGDVRVDLSTNGGSGWSTIIPRTPNNGAVQWMVTGLASTQARVRVLSLDSPSVSDDSNGNFTIAGLHVTSPQGGESWRNSTLQTLRWNSVGVVGNVNIDLSIDGGVSWVALFMNTPNDGEQSWNVNATPTTNARIRIASVSDARIVALSPNPFTILPVEHQ